MKRDFNPTSCPRGQAGSQSGKARANAPLRVSASALTLLCVAGGASAQQFLHETASRFPAQPSEWTNQLSIADVDNDGALDIAWANGCCFSGSGGAALPARLYINNGSGFFTDESAARVGVSGWFRGVEFGDVDSDGYLDMGLANDYNKLPRLLMNRGDAQPGFFDDETGSRLPSVPLSSSRVQFFDSNNNGHLDLIFTHGGSVNRFGTGLTRLYINDGSGFFTDQSNLLPPASVTGPMDAQIGDVTNDFNLDIRIGALGTNNSKLFINNGDGTFSNASATVPNDSTCYAYDMGDIDGNGTLDMLGANAGAGSQELLIRNNGDGTWTNVSGQIINNPGIDDNDSKFFDYNNNGDLDLIIAAIGGGGAERLYRNVGGTGTFGQVTTAIQTQNDSSLDVVVADVTGDGALDIVTAQGESGNFTNRIYVNHGAADTIPPNIVQTEQLEDTDDTKGPYVVRAFITDSHTGDQNFHHKGIHINYSHNGGAVQQVPMKFSGGTIYRGEIPGLSPGEVEYYITAIDHNNNLGTGETLSFTIDGDVAVPGDLDGYGSVGVPDLLILLGAWGDCDNCPADPCDADLDDDCSVGVPDLLLLLGNWG